MQPPVFYVFFLPAFNLAALQGSNNLTSVPHLGAGVFQKALQRAEALKRATPCPATQKLGVGAGRTEAGVAPRAPSKERAGGPRTAGQSGLTGKSGQTKTGRKRAGLSGAATKRTKDNGVQKKAKTNGTNGVQKKAKAKSGRRLEGKTPQAAAKTGPGFRCSEKGRGFQKTLRKEESKGLLLWAGAGTRESLRG